jgi:hypothetical protein
MTYSHLLLAQALVLQAIQVSELRTQLAVESLATVVDKPQVSVALVRRLFFMALDPSSENLVHGFVSTSTLSLKSTDGIL